MADLSITAANVVATSGSIVSGYAGATITAGQAVYLDDTDVRFKLADANDTAAKAVVRGIALHAASSGQPLDVFTAGDITIGGTVAVGTVYVLSTTAGGIAPIGDLATDSYVSVIGVGKTTAILTVGILNSGVQKAA